MRRTTTGQTRHSRKEDKNRRRREGVAFARKRKRINRERRAAHVALMARER
jgi:hypothetical protein